MGSIQMSVGKVGKTIENRDFLTSLNYLFLSVYIWLVRSNTFLFNTGHQDAAASLNIYICLCFVNSGSKSGRGKRGNGIPDELGTKKFFTSER